MWEFPIILTQEGPKMKRKRYFFQLRVLPGEKHQVGEIPAWPSVLENPFRFRRLGIGRRWSGVDRVRVKFERH